MHSKKIPGLLQRIGKFKKRFEQSVRAYVENPPTSVPIPSKNNEVNFGLPPKTDDFDYHGIKIWTRSGDSLLSGSGTNYTYIQFQQRTPDFAKFKIYLTLNESHVADHLPDIIKASQIAGAVALKVKFEQDMKVGRDRIIMYFSNFENTVNFAKQLDKKFSEMEIYGDDLPFTLQIGEKRSPVYIAADPFTALNQTSWRTKITSVIAKALEETVNIQQDNQRIQLIRETLQNEGIDPDFWLPFEFARIYGQMSDYPL